MELTFFSEFRGRNLVCFCIAYNFNGKFAPEAGKARMRTAFFTRVHSDNILGAAMFTFVINYKILTMHGEGKQRILLSG